MASIKSQGFVVFCCILLVVLWHPKGLLLLHVFSNKNAANIACLLLSVSRTIEIWRYALSMLCPCGIKNDTIYFSENVTGAMVGLQKSIFCWTQTINT